MTTTQERTISVVRATTSYAKGWRGGEGYFAGLPHTPQEYFQFSASGFGGVEQQTRWHDIDVQLLGLGLGELGTQDDRISLYRQAAHSTTPIIVSCWRCGKRHIASGSLASLPERDTCGAYLPAWYPAEKYDHPWMYCKSLWLEMMYLVESKRDYNFNIPGVVQQKPTPSLEYHPPHTRWKSMNINCQGWWKCRDGPDASQVELSCNICHKTRVVEKDPLQKEFDVKKQALVRWVYDCLKHLGYNRETAKAAEALVLRQGIARIMEVCVYLITCFIDT